MSEQEIPEGRIQLAAIARGLGVPFAVDFGTTPDLDWEVPHFHRSLDGVVKYCGPWMARSGVVMSLTWMSIGARATVARPLAPPPTPNQWTELDATPARALARAIYDVMQARAGE